MRECGKHGVQHRVSLVVNQESKLRILDRRNGDPNKRDDRKQSADRDAAEGDSIAIRSSVSSVRKVHYAYGNKRTGLRRPEEPRDRERDRDRERVAGQFKQLSQGLQREACIESTGVISNGARSPFPAPNPKCPVTPFDFRLCHGH